MRDFDSRIKIRPADDRDAESIATIYNFYVAQSAVTFEEEPVSVGEIARRISEVQLASLPWLAAEKDGQVLGYAYATPWKSRSAYRFSVEITIYLADGQGGRGIGSALYAELFALLKARGIHAVIGGIALPNGASVALQEKFGMSKVAHFKEVGFKFGRWIDVGYWELEL